MLTGQTSWGWKIAAYLFLAGVGAGAYTIGVFIDIFSITRIFFASKIGIIIGPVLVFIGMLFLIADLGSKGIAYKAYKNPRSSWIARGTIIISIFMILGALHIAGWIWPFTVFDKLAIIRQTIGSVNLIFALGTMIYTGLLLAANKSIPFWSNPIVPLLFLVSALSTGIMAIILILVIDGMMFGLLIGQQLDLLSQYHMWLIVLEILIIGLYLQATHQNITSKATANLILKGKLAPEFWGGIVVLGLAIPLLADLSSVAVFWGMHGMPFLIIMLANALGLIGGLFLRHVVLAGGIKVPFTIGSMVFPQREEFSL
jgi:formate-dependent nitrite reductase membrane component NrfD